MAEQAVSKLCPACGASYPPDYAVCPRDATPLSREGGGDDPLLGQVLGDTYEVTRLIGEGGMGRVYEARHVRLGRRFALKVLHRMFAGDKDALARFRREAMAAAAIASPHVAQVVDVNATRDGQPYLVSELLEGEDLAVLLKREGALSVGRAVHVARQVARGLSAAHQAGVIHRDLKPENVMLVRGPDGRDLAKVLDFGIAKTANDGHLTRTGAVLGTPAYMAPEQARGGSTIDHRCDVYALGAMLYRALTGRPAFTGEDAGRTLTSVIHDEPERPKTLRKDLPDALELLVQRAMAKDPTGRFSSMAELDAALEAFDTAPVIVTEGPGGAPAPLGDPARAATLAVQSGETLRSVSFRTSDAAAQARWARPRAIAYGIAAFAWCVVLLGSIVGRAITTLSGRPLSHVERVLDVALALALAAPLVVLEVRRLVRGAWRNTATMVARAERLARAGVLSLAAYACLSAPGRFWALLERGGVGASLIEWAALVASLATGAWVLLRPRR
jgi:serine/threonine-protein kinase